ncbi:MAG: hypothetical protein JWQ87_1853 [Candidatus Sulfotelmatobacter sp.]|nr:hypothetical protein [Candidatus Sulfotelmatobacter sp.]
MPLTNSVTGKSENFDEKSNALAARALYAALVLAKSSGEFYLAWLDASESEKIRALAAGGYAPILLLAQTAKGFEAAASDDIEFWKTKRAYRTLAAASVEFQIAVTAMQTHQPAN